MSLINQVSEALDKIGTEAEQATVTILDKILSSRTAQIAEAAVMLSSSMAVAQSSRGNQTYGDSPVVALYSAVGKAMPGMSTIVGNIEEAMAVPNLAGVPINVTHYSDSREVEVSESMVIVQSSSEKKYWTDNAVPRLMEWTIEGYITSLSTLDNGLRIKPTLTWQCYYLDICAKSRRPIMFKTSRGEFILVQITNLSFEEDPTYNNAIHINVSLKEYNPYFITDTQGSFINTTFRREEA